jgi:branched-chain amino acid transport system permease protein
MFSTFICWELLDRGVPYWIAFLLTLVISFVGGVLIERLVIHVVSRAQALTVVTVTIGLLIFLNGAAAWIWKGEQRTLENPFPTRTFDVGGVVIAAQDLGIIAVSLVIVALLWVFFQKTRVGLGARAAALNPESSRLHGVPVSRMLALGWGLAAVLGAVAGILVAPTPAASTRTDAADPASTRSPRRCSAARQPVGAVVGGLALGDRART